MARHKIQLTLDEATGQVTVRHFVTVDLGGHAVVIHEDIPADPSTAAKLKAAIDANRAEMDKRAERAAIRHVAALTKTAKGKQLDLKGEVAIDGSLVGEVK